MVVIDSGSENFKKSSFPSSGPTIRITPVPLIHRTPNFGNLKCQAIRLTEAGQLSYATRVILHAQFPIIGGSRTSDVHPITGHRETWASKTVRARDVPETKWGVSMVGSVSQILGQTPLHPSLEAWFSMNRSESITVAMDTRSPTIRGTMRPGLRSRGTHLSSCLSLVTQDRSMMTISITQSLFGRSREVGAYCPERKPHSSSGSGFSARILNKNA